MRVVAFGVSMPVSRFIRDIGPMLCFPMWPLAVAATLAQLVFLIDQGGTGSRSIWQIALAILLAPMAAIVLRLIWYVFRLPDVFPFGNARSTSLYASTISLSAVTSILIGYGALSWLILIA